jgi:chromosome segregation ATPase
MLRVYILIVVVMAVAGIGYGAKYYYDTTQATIATLRENNAKLEGAVKTAEASLALLQDNIVKLSKLNKNLQADLQKAEAYGDELRVKLNRLNLVQEALRNNEYDLPSWLQPLPAGTGDQNSDESGEGSDTDSIEAETSSTN